MDLQELSNADFYNPSNDKRGNDFYKFVQESARSRFARWELPLSELKVSHRVLDPKTNEPYKSTIWPATKQALQVPIGPPFKRNILENLICWVYDLQKATTIVKTPNDELVLHTPRDLL